MRSQLFAIKFFCILFSLVAFCPVMAGHYTATWTNGQGTENWSDPNNWDIGQVPLNGLNTFDVVIGGGFTVYFDIDQPGFVTDLELASGSTLVIDPGHSLTLLDDVTLTGTVQADGAATDLIASSAGTALEDGAKLYASNGGSIECATASYSSKTLSSNVTLFSADGYGSRIDLSAMQSLDARFTTNYRTQTISATNLGVIDMSEVGTLYGSNTSLSLLNIYMGSGGFINLYYLTDISGGYTKFDIDVPYYTFPSLETALQTTFDIDATTLLSLPVMHTAEKCTFTIPDGAVVNAPVLTNLLNCSLNLNPNRTFINGGLTNIDNSRIELTEGMQFGTAYGDITATSYTSTAISDNVNLFSASGTDTILDLSSLEVLNTNFGTNYRTQTISATENGIVDLSSVGTAYGSTTSLSRVKYFIDTNGNINLSSLQDIPSGYTTFDINIASWSLPVLQNAWGVTFDLAGSTTQNLPQLTTMDHCTLTLADGATLNAPLLTSFTYSTANLNPSRTFVNATLAAIDNSTFALTDGAQFGYANGDINATSYSSAGLNDHYTIFSAAGTGTILDLSCLETLNAGFSANYRTHTVSATDNGVIDLSSVGTLYGAASSLSTFKFVLDTSGDIDLSSLQSIPSGYTTFDIDIPSWSLPLLQTGSGITFDLSGISTLDLPELTTLTSCNLTLADGAIFNAPQLTSLTYSILDLNAARTFINGTLTNIDNTQIALSGGAEFGAATGDLNITTFSSAGLNNNYTVLSVDGEGTLLDMSTVQTIYSTFTANYRTQIFSVTNNGTLDWSNVGLFTGTSNSLSHSNVIVDSGGQLLTGDNLTFNGYSELNINGIDSQLTSTGNLTMNQLTRFFATDSATLSLAGNFSYRQTNEANFNTDTGIIRFDTANPATLEVGGANLGLGGATSGNFGIGRLIIGGTQPTTLSLVDLADNQSDGVNNEALYLYGSGGTEGLRIAADSTLIIGNIDVYAYLEGQMIHINSLFTPGVKWIPFDEGKITLTEYECTLAADLTGDCFVGLDDFAVMAAEWLQCGDLDCP